MSREVISLRSILRSFAKVFALSALFLLPFSGVAMAEQNDEYVYKVTDDGVILTSFVATPSNAMRVTVPDTIDGKKVIGLEGTFNENQHIIEVIIPNGVQFIGDYTFHSCSNLEFVDIPDTVTVLGEECFSLSGINSINLHDNLREIGFKCFSHTDITELIFPESLTGIGADMCSGCKELKRADLSNCHFTELASGIFVGCEALTDVMLPSELIEIKSSAFNRCASLKEVTLPESVTSIEYAAFSGCESLESIELPDNLLSIGDEAFRDCHSLKELVIPKNVRTIGKLPASGDGMERIVNNSPLDFTDINKAYGQQYYWYKDEARTEPIDYIPGYGTVYGSLATLHYHRYFDEILKLIPPVIYKDDFEHVKSDVYGDIAVYLTGILEEHGYCSLEGFENITVKIARGPLGLAYVAQSNIVSKDVAETLIDIDYIDEDNPNTLKPDKENNGDSGSGNAGSGDGNGSGSGSSGSGSSGSGSSGSGSSGSGSSGGGSSNSGSSGNSYTQAIEASGKWVVGEKGWWYQFKDGTYPSNGWMQLEWRGKADWYYFNAEGYMVSGWITDVDGHRYFLHAQMDGTQGYMYTGWHQIDGKWYYFSTVSGGPLGSLLINTTTPDGYQVDANGVWIQ